MGSFGEHWGSHALRKDHALARIHDKAFGEHFGHLDLILKDKHGVPRLMMHAADPSINQSMD